MGSNTAQDFAESVSSGALSLDVALLYHLTGNHYPPLPRTFITPAKAAILACQKGQPNKRIKLPAGVFYLGHRTTAPATEVVKFMHLHAFIQGD